MESLRVVGRKALLIVALVGLALVARGANAQEYKIGLVSSLTGLEAISNSVSAFREPQGVNARRTLVAMSIALGIMVLGVSGTSSSWVAGDARIDVRFVNGKVALKSFDRNAAKGK